MKHTLTGAAALLLSAAPVFAGAIERAPQSLSILFEDGNYVEFGAGRASPDVSGRDLAIYGGSRTGNVADDYSFFSLGYKHQFNDQLSGALIVEQPFGADVHYAPVSEGGSFMLGGTSAVVNSTTYTGLLRYKFNENWGVHGGLRGSRADANVTLSGQAYGPLSGYNVDLDSAWGWGYVLGASWDRPDIKARVSLTYNSPIEHEFDSTETLGGAPLRAGETRTTVKTPRSWTLEGQTGVAADTLVFGSVRWVNWSEFQVRPAALSCSPASQLPPCFGVTEGLVSLEDTTTWTLGVGRKFNDNWSGSLSFAYEKAGDKLISPLSPTTGRKSVSLAAIYTQDQWKITTGLTYAKLGDADPETGTPDVARAQMRDSDLLGFGIRVGYRF